MGNLADVAISVVLGIALGVASGLLLALALVKPIEHYFDNYEGKAYTRVWEAKQG